MNENGYMNATQLFNVSRVRVKKFESWLANDVINNINLQNRQYFHAYWNSRKPKIYDN